MRIVKVAYRTKRDFLLVIHHLHIFHNTPCLLPPNSSITLTLYFLLSSQEKLKTTYAKQGLLWKMWKWWILPFSFFTFLLFTKRANLTRIFFKRGMSIIVGLTKMTFCENGEFGKNLSKAWQKLKQDDKRRMSLILGF